MNTVSIDFSGLDPNPGYPEVVLSSTQRDSIFGRFGDRYSSVEHQNNRDSSVSIVTASLRGSILTN
jgi:hypothetical protein